MIYIKINDTLIPAEISGFMTDRAWDNRESKAITVEMDHATAAATFVDELPWAIVMDVETEDGIVQEEYDNSEFSVAGSITDNRDGTVTIKMGKPTAEERLAELMEVLA